MAHVLKSAIAAAALMAAVGVFATSAQAQSRLSLAERVDRLEQQQSNPQGGSSGGSVGLVNQISALQSQVQSLQGQVEELKHTLDETRQSGKAQYVDLSSRLSRLEGGAAAPATPGGRAPAPRNDNPPDVDLGGVSNTLPARGSRVPPAADGDLSDADRAALPPGEEPAAGTAAPAANPAAETAAYNEAFAALKDGRYAESARRFQTFIDQYPNGELTGNAYYWLGESYYVTQNYTIAQQSFETLLQRYPKSPKAADALLKVGYSEYEQKQWDKAEATLNQVVQTYPDTTAARLAQGRLRALKLEARH